MKKIEKLQKELAAAQAAITNVSFERKDTSYRRKGGYFGTDKANTNDVIVVSVYARTKYLNTYTCVKVEYKHFVDKLNACKKTLNIEHKRLNNIAERKRETECIYYWSCYISNDISRGVVNTNYAKIFVIGNRNIYYAHPYYGHSDYNKSCAMPNTPKHRRVADQLNTLLFAANPNLKQQIS